MVPTENKAKWLLSVNHTTKTIHHHHDHDHHHHQIKIYLEAGESLSKLDITFKFFSKPLDVILNSNAPCIT